MGIIHTTRKKDFSPTVTLRLPSAPSSLNATNIFKRNFRINWTAATDNVGIKSYDIFVNGSYRGTAAANTNFFLVSGLTAGTTYSVRMSATDLDNNTTSSAAVSLTTAP